MASTVINPCGLMLLDVSTETKIKTILGLMKGFLSTNTYIKCNPGNIYRKL